MPENTRRLRRRRPIFRIIGITVGVLFILFIALGLWVYRQSVSTFEVRRLSLPTRIYADYTPLTPGALISADDLGERLERLGYRQSDSLAQSGDFVPGRGEIDLYTRTFSHPSGQYTAQPIRITFRGGAIDAVVALQQGGNADNAA